MKNRTEQFERLLNRFRFTQPVTPEVRARITRNKKKQFAVILKKTGGYSLTFGIIASLFFTLKKLGMGVSIVKTAIILAVATTVTTVLVVAGVYTTVKHRDLPDQGDADTIEVRNQVEPLTQKNEPAPVIETDTPEAIARRIGVRVFTADGADKNLCLEVTDAIAEELGRLRGKEYTLNIRTGNGGKRYRMMLVGSVEKLDGGHTVSARVSDVRDSRVIFYVSEYVAPGQDMAAACRSIAQKIARSVPGEKSSRGE